MNKLAVPLAMLAIVAGSAAVIPPAADAAVTPHYSNCAALVKAYPHGVRASAKTLNAYTTKGVRHTKATLATVNAKVYQANTHLDADRDGIACER